MTEGLNRVMLMGNLGADPELRFTQGGQAVLNMRLATTESFLDRDGQRKERTEWHSVVVWGKRAEGLGKFLTKGSSLFVEGSIRYSSYDGQDGQKRYKTEINARNIILTGRRGDGGGGSPGGGGGGSRQYGGGAAGEHDQAAPASGGDSYANSAPTYERSYQSATPSPSAAAQGGGFGGPEDDDDDIPF